MSFSESIFKTKSKSKTRTLLSNLKKRVRRKSRIHCENGGVIVSSTDASLDRKTRRHLDQIFSARAQSIRDILLLGGSGRYFCELADSSGYSNKRCRLKIEFKHVTYTGVGDGKNVLEAAANALELLSRESRKTEAFKVAEIPEKIAS